MTVDFWNLLLTEPGAGAIMCLFEQERRSFCCLPVRCANANALVAQLAEHILGRNGVTSSNLVEGSM